MELKIDVLPLGPMIANNSPVATWKETPAMALTPWNQKVHLVQLEQRLAFLAYDTHRDLQGRAPTPLRRAAR